MYYLSLYISICLAVLRYCPSLLEQGDKKSHCLSLVNSDTLAFLKCCEDDNDSPNRFVNDAKEGKGENISTSTTDTESTRKLRTAGGSGRRKRRKKVFSGPRATQYACKRCGQLKVGE